MDSFVDSDTPRDRPDDARTGGSKQAVALEMRNITKRYPGIEAWKGVSISVQAGEVRALLGENGAGKLP